MMNDKSNHIDFEKHTVNHKAKHNRQLIAAEWTSKQEHTTSNEVKARPKVKLKTPLTDINNNLWYKVPNGKWKPYQIVKTTAVKDDKGRYIDGNWVEFERVQQSEINQQFKERKIHVNKCQILKMSITF